MTRQPRRGLLWVVLVLLCVAIVLAVLVRQVRKVGLPAIAAPTWMVLPEVHPHLARPD